MNDDRDRPAWLPQRIDIHIHVDGPIVVQLQSPPPVVPLPADLLKLANDLNASADKLKSADATNPVPTP